jgi:hypothetical protein
MRSSPSASRISCALTAGILLSAAACKKSAPPIDPAKVIVPEGTPALDLSAKPAMLFQVFGDRESPNMMPFAAVVNGAIKPIGLTISGWKQLHDQYLAPGTKYPFYMEGSASGELTVAHDTLYTLPGCQNVKPMETVSLAFKEPRSDPTVEFLASSAPLASQAAESRKMMTSADIAKLGHDIGHALGKRANLSAAELDSIDFHARMISTGASKAPTLLVSFIDPNAGEARPGAWTGHIFALADSGATGYEPTYQHVVKGDPKTVEFQRFVNTVDLNGDGTDEVILEAWKYGASSDLVVLSFVGGKWQEVLRVKQDWCLDVPKQK